MHFKGAVLLNILKGRHDVLKENNWLVSLRSLVWILQVIVFQLTSGLVDGVSLLCKHCKVHNYPMNKRKNQTGTSAIHGVTVCPFKT